MTSWSASASSRTNSTRRGWMPRTHAPRSTRCAPRPGSTSSISPPGGYHNVHYVFPSAAMPVAWLRDEVAAVKAAHPDIPVFGVGAALSVEQAEEVVRDGIADMVALTRAQIADPDLAAQAARGSREQHHPLHPPQPGVPGSREPGAADVVHGEPAGGSRARPTAPPRGGPSAAVARRRRRARGHAGCRRTRRGRPRGDAARARAGARRSAAARTGGARSRQHRPAHRRPDPRPRGGRRRCAARRRGDGRPRRRGGTRRSRDRDRRGRPGDDLPRDRRRVRVGFPHHGHDRRLHRSHRSDRARRPDRRGRRRRHRLRLGHRAHPPADGRCI